jgi:hypothetical protein
MLLHSGPIGTLCFRNVSSDTDLDVAHKDGRAFAAEWRLCHRRRHQPGAFLIISPPLQRERERKRDKEREREKERKREREREGKEERERDRQTETDIERERQKERKREREGERQSDTFIFCLPIFCLPLTPTGRACAWCSTRLGALCV